MYSCEDQSVLEALINAYPESLRLGSSLSAVDNCDRESIWDEIRVSLEEHEVFGKGRQVFAGAHQLQLHPSMITLHVHRALSSRGPKDTLRWLHELFAIETVISRRCAELLGVTLECEVEFNNGVRLVPLESMRPSWHSDQLKYLHSAPRPLIGNLHEDVVGMIQKVEINFSNDVKVYGGDYSPFLNTALGITIAADGAAVVGCAWSEYENTDYADAEFGWSHMPARYEGRSPSFKSVNLNSGHVEIVNNFLSLHGTTNRACAAAAGRLNSAKRRVEIGDSAIDLATAFESLLSSSDERSEITYRLRLRAALILGEGYEDRKDISRRMGELYKLRSKNVHGDVFGTAKPHDREIVNWGIEVCHRLLRMIVQAGRLPNLNKLELTGNSAAAFS